MVWGAQPAFDAMGLRNLTDEGRGLGQAAPECRMCDRDMTHGAGQSDIGKAALFTGVAIIGGK